MNKIGNSLVPTQFDVRFLSQDVKAGMILSFMAIAFGLAIANISHFPLMAGIVSAVVGGIIGSVFGRSPTSIYGSAAALAPILAGSVLTLGNGNEQIGYAATLAVIFVTGCLMTAIGALRLARFFASFFSHPVVSGMLAAIAVILLASRLPMFFGSEFEEHGIHRILEIPSQLHTADPKVFGISCLTLAFLVGLSMLKNKVAFLKRYPPQLFAIPFILALSLWFGLSSEHRVNLPANMTEGLTFPDFATVASDPSIWMSFALIVVILLVVDTAETVATVLGIGRLDKYKRVPDVDKTVMSMGIANVVGSMVGGMSNIPGGAKSTMSTQIGAKTAWTGIICVLFVLVEVVFGREIINLLPQAGLAMIIVFSVMKLAAPSVWKHFLKVGPDQFLVFVVTFVLSVESNDILHGMLAGVALQFLIAMSLSLWAARSLHPQQSVYTIFTIVWNLWTNPLARIVPNDDGYDVHFEGVWLFYKSLDKVFKEIPHGSKVRVHVGEKVHMIDAPTMEKLHAYAERHGMEIIVCATLKSLSSHEEATRIRLQKPITTTA